MCALLIVIFNIDIGNAQQHPEVEFFKRIHIILNDNTHVFGNNVLIDNKSGRIDIYENNTPTYYFNMVKSFKYSNTHLGMPGFLIGISAGIFLPILIDSAMEAYNNEGKGFNIVWDAFPLGYLFAFFTGPLGYKIGSHIYVNWHDYDLNRRYLNNSYSLTTDFSRNRVFLRLKIPIH